MKKAVLLDRDGVINEKAVEGEYVTRWEDFHFLPGVAEAVALLKSSGFTVVIVSNQRCIAKRLVTAAEVEELHHRMSRELATAGAVIDDIYYCPHDYIDQCSCRKPEAGMLLQAASEHGFDLRSSWMVGDSKSDMEAGKRAGCNTVLISPVAKSGIDADLVATSLLDAAKQISARHDNFKNAIGHAKAR